MIVSLIFPAEYLAAMSALVFGPIGWTQMSQSVPLKDGGSGEPQATLLTIEGLTSVYPHMLSQTTGTVEQTSAVATGHSSLLQRSCQMHRSAS